MVKIHLDRNIALQITNNRCYKKINTAKYTCIVLCKGDSSDVRLLD